jgi:hypothetical protein
LGLVLLVVLPEEGVLLVAEGVLLAEPLLHQEEEAVAVVLLPQVVVLKAVLLHHLGEAVGILNLNQQIQSLKKLIYHLNLYHFPCHVTLNMKQ